MKKLVVLALAIVLVSSLILAVQIPLSGGSVQLQPGDKVEIVHAIGGG